MRKDLLKKITLNFEVANVKLILPYLITVLI